LKSIFHKIYLHLTCDSMGQRHLKKKLKKSYSKYETLKIISEICPKRKPPEKKRLERIANSISWVIPKKEEGKQYLHLCGYNAHQGVIGQEYLEKKGCLTIDGGKKCPYYKKFIEQSDWKAWNDKKKKRQFKQKKDERILC